jgi:putative endonuclease
VSGKPGHLSTGARGERAAEEHLRTAGLAVLERNWRPGGPENLEIDLICRDRADGCLVFVEVKTRAAGMRGHPAEAVTAAKREKLRRAASLYLSATDQWDAPCRFDVVAVVRTDEAFAVEHFPAAF